MFLKLARNLRVYRGYISPLPPSSSNVGADTGPPPETATMLQPRCVVFFTIYTLQVFILFIKYSMLSNSLSNVHRLMVIGYVQQKLDSKSKHYIV